MHHHSLTRRSAKVIAMLLLAWIWQTPNVPAAVSILDTTVYPGSGHVYHLLSNSTWTEAEEYAVTLGGHLVTINDALENSYLATLWATNRSLWIGLSDTKVEGTFAWASGDTISYTNFRDGEPNNGGGIEDYVYIYGNGHLNPNGQWNDLADVTFTPDEPLLYGVVEIVPEPSTVAFGIIGGSAILMHLIRRRRAQR